MPGQRYLFIYCRFSVLHDGGSENVEDQEVWGREFGASKFPDLPIRVYVDDGKSAAKDNVYRKDYEDMREAIARGECAQLWVSEQSRLERRLPYLLALGEEFIGTGLDEVHTMREGILRPDSAEWWMRGGMSHEEIRRLRRRVNDKLDIRAKHGRPSGGVTFGYRHDVDPATRHKVLVVVAEQARVLRWAAAEILAGRAKSSVAAELAAQGVRGAMGGKVGPQTIVSWLTNATVAGYRQHRGELARDERGELVRGTWDPILDEDTWQAVRAKLATSDRDHKGERPTRRKYLLSGVAWCARCDAKMTGQMMGNGRGERTPFYRCKSCGSGISAEPVERHLEARLLERLSVLADALADNELEQRREEITSKLAGLRQRRAAAGRMFIAGEMDELGYKAAKTEFDALEAKLLAELGELPAHDRSVDPDALRLAWTKGKDADDVDGQRELVSLFVERVTVRRGRRGGSPGRKVDLSRVDIVGPGWAEAA